MKKGTLINTIGILIMMFTIIVFLNFIVKTPLIGIIATICCLISELIFIIAAHYIESSKEGINMLMIRSTAYTILTIVLGVIKNRVGN